MFWSLKFKYKVQQQKYCGHSFLTCFLIVIFSSKILADAHENNCERPQKSSTKSNLVYLNNTIFPLANHRHLPNQQTADPVGTKNSLLNQKNISRTKFVVLHAFGQEFHLHLECQSNQAYKLDYLNSLNDNKNSSNSHKNSKILLNLTASCLCNGYVDDDPKSTAFLNLCQQDKLVN
jgi:hypothetical protein